MAHRGGLSRPGRRHVTRGYYQPRTFHASRQKRARIGIYVPRTVYARLQREARAKGITVSYLIVRDYIKERAHP